MSARNRRPHIAILGAGPTGLEAALAAHEAGYPFTLYEASDRVAAAVRAWGHVRLFSPWSLDVSPRARRHLAAAGHALPDDDVCPTGGELSERVFQPLAALPPVAAALRLGTRVVAVGREGLLKHQEIGSPARAARRFRLLLENAGGESVAYADRVLDTTGTYDHPNALGDGGIRAPGEAALMADPRLVRHIPDVLGVPAGWAGKTVLLVGAGHSAQTAVRDSAALAERHPGTRVIWALRGAPRFEPIADDALPERAALVRAAGALAAGASPAIEVREGVAVGALRAVDRGGEGVEIDLRRRDDGSVETVRVDRVLSLTGYVGDATLYRQLQVHECYATLGPMKLAAALLGEGSADCLAQASHGADTLTNPEPGFFILGSKSYGRNTTFLMRVGWQQVDEVFGLLESERAAA